MAASAPSLSVVMPVYNTGGLLLESVRSVVEQELFKSEGPGYWELLIVDDASTDEATHIALDRAAALSPAVRILRNRRRKGAAGARNTGIDAALGEWIGFLDSDDLWYPDFLDRLRDAFRDHPEPVWRSAHFHVGNDAAQPKRVPLGERSPCLYAIVKVDHERGRVSVLPRPVDTLLRCGCIGIMTVQVRREALVAAGGFDESLTCAEDYDLWLRLALSHDLHLAPIDAGVYRVRQGSLTKAGRPMFFAEDEMLTSARRNRAFDRYRTEIDHRLKRVYSTFCYHFRQHRQFTRAAGFALKLIRLSPADSTGWRHIVAAALRR